MKKVFLLFIVAAGLIMACNDTAKQPEGEQQDAVTSAESKEERNKQVIMASMEGMKSGNIDIMLKDVAPDAVDYGDGSMPPIKSRDSVHAAIKIWMDAFPDMRGENLVYVADGDYVMVWGDWGGTFTKDFMGMKANKKKFKVKDVDIFKFNDEGKIIEHHNVQSSYTMMAQLGMQHPK